jgi:SAM-dependent methyltransferase
MEDPRLHDTAARIVNAFRAEGAVYFPAAEASMDRQWYTMIYPLIQNMDFTSVLDFAAGYGRNAAKLAPLSQRLTIVEPSPDAVAVLKQRFATPPEGCEIRIVQNSGLDLRDVESSSVSLLYSWDAMVHFNTELVAAYMPEFARVLRPGAQGFLHHSNFGRVSNDPDFQHHPSWRSNMDKDTFARLCYANGLIATRQIPLPWFVAGAGMVDDLDCVTLLAKLPTAG